jgi:hypothetical protein
MTFQAESTVEISTRSAMRRGRPEGHREDALPLPCVEVCADARLAVRERHDGQLQALWRLGRSMTTASRSPNGGAGSPMALCLR